LQSLRKSLRRTFSSGSVGKDRAKKPEISSPSGFDHITHLTKETIAHLYNRGAQGGWGLKGLLELCCALTLPPVGADGDLSRLTVLFEDEGSDGEGSDGEGSDGAPEEPGEPSVDEGFSGVWALAQMSSLRLDEGEEGEDADNMAEVPV
jgi:hypothetical protein